MSTDEQLKHQQLVISKKFSNLARRGEHILIWNKFKLDEASEQTRPILIKDDELEVTELGLVNSTFVMGDYLIHKVCSQREGDAQEGSAYLTFRKEKFLIGDQRHFHKHLTPRKNKNDGCS